MQLIDILKDYINSLEFIPYNIVVNYLSKDKDCMSISPIQGGDREYDVLGNYTEDYQFSIQIKLNSPSVVESSNAIGILNAIGLYFEEANKNESLLPELNEGQEVEHLRILGNPTLLSRDDKNVEIFQCNYVLRYNQYTL